MKHNRIVYDSRQVQPGDTFVAIPGYKVDGANYIPQALERGAKVIVTERDDVKVPEGVDLQRVPSARQALAFLAKKYYNHPTSKLTLIGLTGTNGKTTTAYLIESILRQAGYKVGLIGTIGAKIDGQTIESALTTPESLELQQLLAQMVEAKVTHAVLEVSSHALALDRMAGCEFDIAIFTNLTHDHLDFHKTKEEYLNVKKKLFTMLKPDGIAIINVDDPASNQLIEAVRGEVITYGISQAKHELRSTKQNEFDIVISDIAIREKEMTVKINGLELRTPLIGLHNVYNIAAAYQCGLCLHIPQATIKKGIELLKNVPGRVERVEAGQPFSVIVDFAHSPDALEKLIETYRPLTTGKIILVFGCPGERDKEKRPIMGELAARLADYLIITTDDPHGENPEEIVEEIVAGFSNVQYLKIVDRKAAITKALQLAQKDDTVLIAGRGHEQYQDFAGKKVYLDDRKVVEEILKH
ncbi:UDP-N-acetylmuramoyl-L-alanyl-D-glutamate--2,6-diaminopimelate ligase [Candidatus Saganbacteria bacterium]|nr:UDP-N-acetylmuramoyl-L-alanyl-D-glutamate--2,6-diaminopimelate ligase [Candidatus Saganbacteria bacterium]